MTKSLPLPPRYFQCPALSAREEQYLVAKARESTRALVDATRNNDGPVRWAEMGMHRGVQMYKGEARHPETVVGDPITYGCGATTLRATLEEVAAFFDLSTHAKVRDFVAFNGDMMDSQLLYSLEDPELANKDPLHQITVRWFVIEMPSKLIKNRDFLTIECQNAFVDVSGRRGWVRSYHSIKLPSCPDLQHEYGLVRGSFYHTGHVFIESERPGYLDVIFSAQINLKGNLRLPSALFFIAAKKRLSSVADLQKQLQKRRLGAQRFLGDLELVPKSQRSRCVICSGKFGLLTRKVRCRKCGEVVCTSCSDVWEVSMPKAGTAKVRVCAKCAKSTDRIAVHPDAALTHSQSEIDDDALSSARSGTPSTTTGGYAYGQYDKEVLSSPSVTSTATNRTANGRRGVHSYHQQQSASIGRDPTTRSVDREYYGRNNPRRGPAATTSFHSAGTGDDYPPSEGSEFGEEFEYGHQPHQPGRAPSRQPQQPPPPQPPQYPTSGSVSSGNGRAYRQGSGGYDDPYARRQQPSTPMRQNRGVGNGSDPAMRRGLPARDPFEEQQARALEMNNQAQRLRQQYQEQQRAMHGYGASKADVVNPLPPAHHHPASRETQASDDTVSSASDFDDVGAGLTLTPQMLAMHTRQMGKPGPVTRNPAQYNPQGVATRQARPPPPPQQTYQSAGYGASPQFPSQAASPGYSSPPQRGYGNQRGGYNEFDLPPAYNQLYGAPPPAVSSGERYGRTKSHRSQLSSADSGAPDDYDVRSYHSGRSNSRNLPQQQQQQQQSVPQQQQSAPQQYAPLGVANDLDARSERSQPRFRQVSSSSGSNSDSGGHTSGGNSSNRPPPAKHAPSPSMHSDVEDEAGDQFDHDDVGSPITNALADNFSNLLRPEDLRSTVESFRFSVGSSTMDPAMSFCESLNDYDENPMPFGSNSRAAPSSGAAAAAAAKEAPDKSQPVTKTMIVHVYQQILELTKRQHELDSSPTADPAEKSEVARELQTLYQKLNQITQDPEVEL